MAHWLIGVIGENPQALFEDAAESLGSDYHTIVDSTYEGYFGAGELPANQPTIGFIQDGVPPQTSFYEPEGQMTIQELQELAGDLPLAIVDFHR